MNRTHTCYNVHDPWRDGTVDRNKFIVLDDYEHPENSGKFATIEEDKLVRRLAATEAKNRLADKDGN